jgi:hypothetical protein
MNANKLIIIFALPVFFTAHAETKTSATVKSHSTTVQGKSSVSPIMNPPIRAGAMISVESYDAKSKTYSIVLIKEPGVGPNIALPGDLLNSVSTLTKNELELRPESIVGNSYQLDKELLLLSDKGLALRLKAQQKIKK